MAETIRERIIAAFTDRAAPLSNLDIERAKRNLGESNDRFISIWDGEDQLLESRYGKEQLQFPLALECIWKHGSDNPSASANELMGEIITTMIGIGKDRTFGGLVDKVTAATKSPQYPADGSDYTTLTVIFLINYTTVVGDPYVV
ncbi:hypothetical protein [Methylobacter marinus]|uniref:hypothetical protein n=1 Tax=Methylobacter marinus TaxID=34058 RepID=UPI0003642B30|nr:hypothetical protein [Methylobacter marinus]